ncbi:TlpA family protein disulfide reductase [Chryseolinea lacunae]|uniref:Redoxin family protein n=1 Tax=Chryseolinea lacunae TaxID=2801331 RepID=A0ABS1KRI4_9BACT|nr:redoxin family protein [Chryseolinea lacunae]MBL0742090.1 redoxin family protein [Chryseolinea lacunae]
MTSLSDVAKRWLAALVLTVFAVVIVLIFWQQELKYTLPTPVPAAYAAVQPGDAVTLPMSFQKGHAYFIHFYNPDCPCSRFNARHIQSLMQDHGDSVHFVIVVANASMIDDARKALGASLTFVTDHDGAVAKACGVYSTPQAAIVSGEGTLFYRGNYNRARYCTSRATNFAELSLLALLQHAPPPMFGLAATQSYGCELNAADADPIFF